MISTFSPDVYDDAAKKHLRDARHFNRNAARLLAWSLVGFIVDAVLLVAAVLVFCKAAGF